MSLMRFCYIRIGEIPPTEKSRIHRGDTIVGEELGVSVWEAVELDGKFRILIPNPCNEAAMTDIYDSFLKSDWYRSVPVYELEGDVVGVGSDGEPLLRNIKNVRKLGNDIEDVFPHEHIS